MAEPTSWEAIDCTVSLLTQISIANGYYTDIGVLATAEPGQGESDAPQLAVVATTFEPKPETSSSRLRREDMSVVIEFSVPFGAVGAQKSAHRGLADIRKALGSTARPFPDSTFGLVFQSAQIMQRPDGLASVVAQVIARIGLEERLAAA